MSEFERHFPETIRQLDLLIARGRFKHPKDDFLDRIDDETALDKEGRKQDYFKNGQRFDPENGCHRLAERIFNCAVRCERDMRR